MDIQSIIGALGAKKASEPKLSLAQEAQPMTKQEEPFDLFKSMWENSLPKEAQQPQVSYLDLLKMISGQPAQQSAQPLPYLGGTFGQ